MEYVEVGTLLRMFEEDAELSCEPPEDIYAWAKEVIAECPRVTDIVQSPVRAGQKVWFADGRVGYVEALYLGAQGVQRIFVKDKKGNRINLKPKGIGVDVFLEKPKAVKEGGEAVAKEASNECG